ncbi:MAG: 4-alpha-glucanotransferase [Candidatus Omnitrophota bacterium]|nr:4-alpha-glucanotransferase [Candidatus Omnitrophota bacterium]
MPQLNLTEYLFNTDSSDKWKRIGPYKRAGVLAPLFSIYSKESLGVGEFLDLKLLIDWCVQTGNSIIQLLPINEVGWLACPYDSISSFALEPLYIRLNSTNADCADIKKIKLAFPTGEPYVRYGVKNEKMRLLWEAYFYKREKEPLAFKKFKEENVYWLLGFALYKALKDYYKGSPWYEWEDKYKNRDTQALESFKVEYAREINFHIWVQWLLYEQLKEVKAHASLKNVLIKGDLPILVSRDSADVWEHAHFFKLEFAAGAPPDMYCAKGQRWGMPTYNWENIASDGYRYIKEKLKYAQNFYDILRLDHVVGLFRIWSIPYEEPIENKGMSGFFDPINENLWLAQGRNLLRIMLESTNMLLCAEDLGVIPKVCTDTLKELGIAGNDVQRWVKDWDIRYDFLKPDEYRPISVAMLSTHDTTNWPAWWENEAGTVDEALFARKCNERGIDYNRVRYELFDLSRSCHGRLRWKNDIDSPDKLLLSLGKRREDVLDFIEMYENTYNEKEKLWRQLLIGSTLREDSNAEIIAAVLKLTLGSNAIFCINTLIDLLYLGDILEDDSFVYRLNTPGIVSDKNWSLTIPISLEDLLRQKINKEIRRLNCECGRVK